MVIRAGRHAATATTLAPTQDAPMTVRANPGRGTQDLVEHPNPREGRAPPHHTADGDTRNASERKGPERGGGDLP